MTKKSSPGNASIVHPISMFGVFGASSAQTLADEIKYFLTHSLLNEVLKRWISLQSFLETWAFHIAKAQLHAPNPRNPMAHPSLRLQSQVPSTHYAPYKGMTKKSSLGKAPISDPLSIFGAVLRRNSAQSLADAIEQFLVHS